MIITPDGDIYDEDYDGQNHGEVESVPLDGTVGPQPRMRDYRFQNPMSDSALHYNVLEGKKQAQEMERVERLSPGTAGQAFNWNGEAIQVEELVKRRRLERGMRLPLQAAEPIGLRGAPDAGEGGDFIWLVRLVR